MRNALRNVIGLLQRHQEMLGLDGSVGRNKSFFFLSFFLQNTLTESVQVVSGSVSEAI